MNCCQKSVKGLGFLLLGVCGFSILASDSAKGWSTVTSETGVYQEALVDSHVNAIGLESLQEPTVVNVEDADGYVVQSHLFTACVSKRRIRRR